MIGKKILITIALVLTISMIACAAGASAVTSDAAQSAGEESVIRLKVWGPSDEQDLLQEMIASFIARYPDKTFEIETESVAELETYARYIEDPAAAADVFAFANDQLRDFVNAGGLYEVTRADDLAYIESGITSFAADSATLNDSVWAYPEAAGNGYFLYYDNSVLNADDIKTLDRMITAAEAADKKIFMDLANGYYLASFFLGNGCELSISEDGTTQICDFNSEQGLAAAEGLQAFVDSGVFMGGRDSDLTEGFRDGVIAAGVSGTWNADAIIQALGDHFAAAKLPTYTTGDGQQAQMASFGGTILVGVNGQTAHPDEAMDLAMWLTNEENQLKRFEARHLEPANSNAAATDAVMSDAALAALAEQSEFAVSQKDITASYWAPALAFGELLEAHDAGLDLQALLDEMVAQITAEG